MHINEDAFLHELFPRLTVDQKVIIPPGDDCAALSLGGDELLLLTVDQVAGGIHYYDHAAAHPTPPQLAGRKLMARNLSDIAAMGGKPAYALLALAVASAIPRDWLDEFTRGVLQCAGEYGVHIIGGDLSSARAEVASLTLLGWVNAERVCKRDQAQAGDAIFITGQFGASLSTGKHLTFQPRLAEAQWLAEHRFARAMIDVSDGLLQDLRRLCLASRLDAIIDETQIPRTIYEAGMVTLNEALLDGEDYELIFAVSPQHKEQLLAQWPFALSLTDIGHFADVKTRPSVYNLDGLDLATVFGPGYAHFSP